MGRTLLFFVACILVVAGIAVQFDLGAASRDELAGAGKLRDLMHEANRRGEAQNAIDLQRSIDTAQSTALAYSVMRVVLVVVVGVILAFAIRLSANRPVQSEFREREFS